MLLQNCSFQYLFSNYLNQPFICSNYLSRLRKRPGVQTRCTTLKKTCDKTTTLSSFINIDAIGPAYKQLLLGVSVSEPSAIISKSNLLSCIYNPHYHHVHIRGFKTMSKPKVFGSAAKEKLTSIESDEKASIDAVSSIISKHSDADTGHIRDLQTAFASGMKYANSSHRGPGVYGSFLRYLGIFLRFAGLSAIAIIGYQTYNQGKISLPTNVSSVNPESVNLLFTDVIGCEEAKEELKSVVEYLKDPNKYIDNGANLPKGILLVGPPGIGKTRLAKALAGEAKVPFFHATGSEFDEMFVGVGANRIRKLFNAAKSHKGPSIIFIDEIDVVGAKRTQSAMHPYANQTVTQLLAEMDGFVGNSGLIVIGATNFRENLDPALMRPGRFDVEVQLTVPTFSDRKDIFKYYLTKVNHDPLLNIDKLARLTIGATGAEICNIVNQSALKAVKDNGGIIDMECVNYSRDKVLMGAESKIKDLDESENLKTAIHEAGHSIVAHFTKEAQPLHKITIIRRGQSLGHTAFLPKKDNYTYSKSQLLAQIDVAMGGRVAEHLKYGENEVSSGASSDFQFATNVAEAMIKRYGMSSIVGYRYIDSDKSQQYASESFKKLMDSEINKILEDSYERAKSVLLDNWEIYLTLVDNLMDKETLDTDDINGILNAKI